MSMRRFVSGVLIFVFVAAVAVFPLPAAHAQTPIQFESAASSCEEAIFSFDFTSKPPVETSPSLAVSFTFAAVSAEDSQGTPLGEEYFDYAGSGVLYEGTITYSQRPVGDVTLTLWIAPVGVSALHPGQIDGYYFAVDSVTIPAQCDAGCDTLIAIPSQAVMGQFVSDALLYYTPGQLIVPNLTVPAGKTYLVIGQDASGQFRKILLQCQFVWVPLNSVGPDPEPLWNNKPLPTTVVQ